MSPEKAVVLEWDRDAVAYRWVPGADLPMSHFDAEARAAELSAAHGHFLTVPVSRLDGKRILRPSPRGY